MFCQVVCISNPLQCPYFTKRKGCSFGSMMVAMGTSNVKLAYKAPEQLEYPLTRKSAPGRSISTGTYTSGNNIHRTAEGTVDV